MGDRKIPVLRKGITVEHLFTGVQVGCGVHVKALKAAYEVFITEHLNKGKRASRKDCADFARDLGCAAKEVAESIRKRINSGELTATLLDELIQ
jgi:hypothetical protein